MPMGKGTYGSKVGRPSKAAKAKGMKKMAKKMQERINVLEERVNVLEEIKEDLDNGETNS